jgi:nucleoside 2-deoxyribosyltransferase
VKDEEKKKVYLAGPAAFRADAGASPTTHFLY